ncbi:MAG TPA: hypothetical protein VGC45_12930 [Gryllotalpicola sp.]
MLRNRTIAFTGTAVLALALTFGAGITAANASTTTSEPALTPDQEASLRSNMTAVGISPAMRDRLIDKLESGQALDSMTGATPTSESTEDLGTVTRTISVYPDGSIRTEDIENPTVATPAGTLGGVHVLESISGCTTSGGWHNGCTVKIADLVSSAWFVIDYMPSSANAAQVRDMRQKTCANAIGSCSVSGSIKRANQSSAGPAWAEMSYTAHAGPITDSGAMGIRVSGTKVTLY